MIRSLLRPLYFLYQWFIFVPLLLIFTILGGVIVMVLAPFRMREQGSAVAVIWARLVCWVTPLKVGVKGKEHIRKGRSYVAISNHQSLFDIPVIYGMTGIDPKFVMKRSLKKIPLFGQACAAQGHVFVDRSDRKKAIESLNNSVKNLFEGESVIIFPEGTRSRDGKVKAFRKGAFRLALATGMPILPISVVGTERVQPPDTLHLEPGKVGVRIHEPIEVTTMSEEELPELMERSQERVVRGKLELEEEWGIPSNERTVEDDALS